MSASTKPGWKYNSDGKLEATFRQNVLNSNGAGSFKNNIVVVANSTTGGYDAYYDNRSPLGISFGRTALYSFNPETGRITPYEDNRKLFDRVYPGGVTDPQLQSINKSTKDGVISNLELNASDPVDQANLKKIRELEGYKTQNNTLPISKSDSETESQGTSDTDAEDQGQTANNEYDQAESDTVGSQVGTLTAVQRTEFAQALTYPEDLAQSYQDYLKIQMVEYKPRGFASGEDSFTLPSRPNIGEGGQVPEGRNILSSIFLPIPGGIGDNNVASWSKGDMSPIQGQIANLSYQAMAGDGQGIRETVGQMTDKVQNNTAGLKALVTQSIIKELTGVDVLRRQQGAVINQNSELLFDGPGLRSFTFTYKFSPRGGAEAQTVKKIIRTLKQGMSAKKANNFLFIKSPHTFFLSYQHQNKIHPFLNKFKECALTSLGVNYTPDGNYATYYDGSMVSYQVTMTFQEIEPIFDNDYGNGYNNIGF